MTKNELNIWFRNKFNNCYPVIHDDYPESIFMYYEPQFIRQKKMSRILGETLENPEKPSGICLFEQDHKNGYLYMDHDEITSFFYENYMNNWVEVKELIQGWLKEDTKLKVLTPFIFGCLRTSLLKEDTKLKVLTPISNNSILFKLLKEDTKLKVLTPKNFDLRIGKQLKEDTKLKVLTPNQYY